MITIRTTEYPNIIYLEVKESITKEDTDKSEAFIQENFGDKDTVNGMIDIKNIDSVTAKAVLKGLLLDIRHWNQYGKFAVIAEKDWIERAAKIADIAPGIEVKLFERAQTGKAFDWLQT